MTPEFLADLAQSLVDAYINMETELMMKIIDYVTKNSSLLQLYDVSGEAVEVMHWQAARLADLGGLNEENIKIIAQFSGKTPSELRRMFDVAMEKGLKQDESILSLGAKRGVLHDAVPLGQSAVVKMLEVAQRATLTTFNVLNNSLLRSAGDQYVKIINQVATQVMGGTMTVNQAVARSVKAFAQEGLTGFTAANGAQWTPEAYSRMALQADLKNAVSAAQEQRYREYGNSHVEVSAYAGARPKCANDQGYIYSLNDDTTPIEDLDGNLIEVRAWSNSSYGEPDGILGINCGHSRWAFVPGLSTQANKNSSIDPEENNKKYKERQQQRYIERNIRNAKREVALLEKSGASPVDVNAAKAKVGEWQSRARNFVKETGGTRYYEREQIYVNSNLINGSPSGILTRSEAPTGFGNWRLSQSGTVMPTQIIEGQYSPSKRGIPNSVIQHSSVSGQVNRDFFDEHGWMAKQVHGGAHGNRKHHPFGENGEHAHYWRYDGKGNIIDRDAIEIRPEDRDTNVDIL